MIGMWRAQTFHVIPTGQNQMKEHATIAWKATWNILQPSSNHISPHYKRVRWEVSKNTWNLLTLWYYSEIFEAMTMQERSSKTLALGELYQAWITWKIFLGASFAKTCRNTGCNMDWKACKQTSSNTDTLTLADTNTAPTGWMNLRPQRCNTLGRLSAARLWGYCWPWHWRTHNDSHLDCAFYIISEPW